MPETPNYKETTLSGSQYTRAVKVIIHNPRGEAPSLMMYEEDVAIINGAEIKTPAGALACDFDPTNQLHLDIYAKLNELYTILREARDQAA